MGHFHLIHRFSKEIKNCPVMITVIIVSDRWLLSVNYVMYTFVTYSKVNSLVVASLTGTKRSYGRGPGRPGVSEIEVVRAAEGLLREGKRPTVAAVRERTGGSNATVAPLLDVWWRSFGDRIAQGPAAFERIPGALAHVAEALWLQTLSEARVRARQEAVSTTQQTELDKADIEVRSHVLTLREGELEERLRRREKGCAELEAQVRALTVLLRKEQANTASAERRLTAIQAELDAIHTRAAAKKSSPRASVRKSKVRSRGARQQKKTVGRQARKRRSR
jgi:Plasmid replication region DNA-binding N-term